MSKQYYFVWSNEHQGWWRGGSFGYTDDRRQARRYSLEEATQICLLANRFSDSAVPNEAIVPIDEQWKLTL